MMGGPRSTSAPRVVVDGRMLGASGIGTYLRNMLPRIVDARPDWRFTILGVPSAIYELGLSSRPNVQVRPTRATIYSIREQLTLSTYASVGADVFWSPHYNAPVATRARLVVTVHDVMHLVLPEYRGTWARRRYASAMFGAVKRNASAIVCVSDFTRRELTRVVGDLPAATVVRNGVEPIWFDRSWSASFRERPYIVFVGAPKPHKNLVGLLRAFAMVRDDIPHDLVIVTANRDALRTIDPAIESLARPLGSRVEIIDGLDASELRRCVSGAELLVQPSLYEGFGLPPLEAMAAGTPCLVARIEALAEVCGDAAAYCDPTNPADIAAQVVDLLSNPSMRQTMRDRGRERARLFTWDAAAAQTLDVVERVLAA